MHSTTTRPTGASSPLSSSCSPHPRDLHSFPTRRSSDLAGLTRGADGRLWGVMRNADSENPGEIYYIGADGDRKSTRLNSSHMSISYAVFCLKKKKKRIRTPA